MKRNSQVTEKTIKEVVPENAASMDITALWDMTQFEGFTFAWRSWAWQVRSVATAGMNPSIRMFANSNIMRMDKLLANNAFFMMTKSDVEYVAESLKHDLGDASNLVETLITATQKILGVTEDEVCVSPPACTRNHQFAENNES